LILKRKKEMNKAKKIIYLMKNKLKMILEFYLSLIFSELHIRYLNVNLFNLWVDLIKGSNVS
jgi:hypothetical protein